MACRPATRSAPLVYSLGHRNPQGLAWDAQGRLWAAEFGQNTWDEINQIVAGGNYGWPTVEGMGSNPQFRNPAVVWTTAEASPSGLAFANNTLFAAALRGHAAVDGAGQRQRRPPARRWPSCRASSAGCAPSCVGPDGWLWVATSNRDGRGTPVATDDRVLRFPPVGTPDDHDHDDHAPPRPHHHHDDVAAADHHHHDHDDLAAADHHDDTTAGRWGVLGDLHADQLVAGRLPG